MATGAAVGREAVWRYPAVSQFLNLFPELFNLPEVIDTLLKMRLVPSEISEIPTGHVLAAGGVTVVLGPNPKNFEYCEFSVKFKKRSLDHLPVFSELA